MKKTVSPFGVFQKMMSDDNKSLMLAPLTNVINMQKTKHGDQITIGCLSGTMMKIYNGEVVGGFIIADRSEFNRVKAQMEGEDARHS